MASLAYLMLFMFFASSTLAGVDVETLETWEREKQAEKAAEKWDGETLPPKYNTILQDYCRTHRNPIAHVPRDDVAFKPGVDKEGWHIPPADLNEPLTIDSFSIPITIPLTPHLKNPAAYNVDLSDTNIHAGTLTINSDGSVLFNGKPLNPNTNAWEHICSAR